MNLLGELRAGDRVEGMIRSQMTPKECTVVSVGDTEICVDFDEALYGVAPGQSLVLYRGEGVVGGGVIVGGK